MATQDERDQQAREQQAREQQQASRSMRNPTAREGDADAQRRNPANREYTTAGGTPRYSVQPAGVSDPMTSTSLEGDPAPGTPDNQLTDAQRKQRDKLRQAAKQQTNYDGRGNVSQGDGTQQSSGVTGVTTSGGVATVTTGAPEGTPDPSNPGKDTTTSMGTQPRTGAQRATGGESPATGTTSSTTDGKR